MKRKIKRGATSQVVAIRVDDTRSSTGAGLETLAYNASGLTARFLRSDQSAWTTISLTSGTLGSWVSGGLVEAGRGVYELSLPNAALSAGTWVVVQVYGAANMADVNLEIELDALDYQDAAGAGLARLETLAGVTSLAQWLRLLARKGSGDATALSELNLGGGTYAPATDSLEGSVDSGGSGLTAAAVWAHASRTLTQSGSQVAAAVAGGRIVLMAGDRVTISLSGLGSLAGRSQAWFTVKRYPKSDADSDAVAQVLESGGLTVLNGAPYATASHGAITVEDEETGTLTVRLDAAATAQLTGEAKLTYDLQLLFADGPVTRLRGRLDVEGDVTRAVS